MAIAVYSTDLVDISTAESVTNWAEPTAVGWTLGAVPALDTENYIQQVNAISKAFNATGVGGMLYNYGSAVTFGTDAAMFAWVYWASPQTLETEANGGIRLIIGNTGAAFNSWIVRGKDSYNYGGWINEAVCPTVTPDYAIGSPTSTKQYFGMVVNNTNAITKGSPCLIDVVRVGRTLQVVSGDLANGYATFLAAAAKNDANDATNGYNRWGLFQDTGGAYLQKGLFLIGTAGTSADFRDSNRNIAIQNTKKVSSTFNAFEIRNSASRVDWTTININSLGTVSKGDVIVTDDATFNVTSCNFSKMGYFTFKPKSIITDTTFRSCGIITQGGATFTGDIITNSAASAALIVDNASLVTNTSFISSGTGHAIRIDSTGTHVFTNLTFTGYAGSPGASGTTGNEALLITSPSGTATINVAGGSNPSYRTLGATVLIVSSADVSLTGLKTNTEVRAYVGTDPATVVEIGAVENSGTSFTFSQSKSGQAGYIMIHSLGYLSLRLDITYSGSNVTIPVQQTVDRQYFNG